MGEVPSPSVAFDYVLLLGLLLFASDLAYVEAQFTVLGPRWPYHLLIVGVVYLLVAYRWDSRTALGLSLATLAAWRGLSISLVPATLGPGVAGDLRASAIVLGALYVGAAALSARLARKAHFEEIFATAGLLLLLGGLLSGVLHDRWAWSTWLVALLAVAGGVMAVAFRLGRSLYFAVALAAAYIALVRLLFEPFRYGLYGMHPLPAGRPARIGRARADLLGASTDAGSMRRQAVAWERAAEVDAAARGWRRVGAIDEATEDGFVRPSGPVRDPGRGVARADRRHGRGHRALHVRRGLHRARA